jgi:serine/threonine protein kinase
MKAGDLLDEKYEILERLGAGGMGEVYKARHTWLGTIRVIKIIRAHIAAKTEMHERFLREAQLATRVQHPNVATLYDFSALPDGTYYTVWEFIDGENLAQRLRYVQTLPPQIAVRIAIETLSGLEAIHRAGIIHRDISPENLMLTHEPQHVKIIDLGVAKSDDPTAKVTQAGMFLGKFRYAAPEQLGFLKAGEAIDGRVDLYALAIVLYEMLSGRPPFEATSPHEYILLHAQEREPRPIDVSDIAGGEGLATVLRRALERDRSKRFGSAAEFSAELERVERSLATAQTVASYPLPTVTLPSTPMATTTAAGRTTVPAIQIPVATTQIEEPRPQLPPRTGGQILVVAAIAGLLILAGVVAWLSREAHAPTPAPAPPHSAPSAGSASSIGTKPQITTTATVTATQPPAPVTDSTPPSTATTQVSSKVQQPPPRRETQPARTSRETTRISEPAATTLTFIDDGGGHAEQNQAAIDAARKSLEGITRVAIRGNASPLLDELKERVAPFLTVDDSSEVVVRFSGTLERFRFGRKRRSASATVTRRGRVIFHYELPLEIYRVGDDPAEAVARVLRKIAGS